MPPDLVTPLLSFLSAALGAGIVGWVTLRSKKDEYANAYYRLVLDRRLAAYEEVERLIIQIKVTVVDGDGKPCHILFFDRTDPAFVYEMLFKIMSQALWLSNDLFEETRNLNRMIYDETRANVGLTHLGKSHYKQIAELRTRIERLHARDMLSLHEVPKFLRNRKPSDSYTELPR